MYSRYHGASDRPIRLPEHYNGCAFAQPREEKREPVAPEPSRQLEVGKPSPPRVSPTPRIDLEETPQQQSRKADDTQDVGVLLPAAPIPNLFRRDGRLHSLLHGIGFEELLLLGLILLLAGNEESSDVVLWLVLLLFCG